MGAVQLADGFVETVVKTGAASLQTPSNVTDMNPDECRRLAVLLIEAAADAERPEPPEWP